MSLKELVSCYHQVHTCHDLIVDALPTLPWMFGWCIVYVLDYFILSDTLQCMFVIKMHERVLYIQWFHASHNVHNFDISYSPRWSWNLPLVPVSVVSVTVVVTPQWSTTVSPIYAKGVKLFWLVCPNNQSTSRTRYQTCVRTDCLST